MLNHKSLQKHINKQTNSKTNLHDTTKLISLNYIFIFWLAEKKTDSERINLPEMLITYIFILEVKIVFSLKIKD